ncbi:hypothetical protein RU89_GL001409 [Lactococcus cremoris]|nr:hypothetical protein llh_8825 [Lactococcus cremoris subsp. cremoris A76]KZK12017.1 hypothetical protein AB995_1259 [Lactococcus cremoris]KZK37914.1 hypothetical protein LMG6897_1793 [Lactococcus cremoris]KZK42651.1 hypothetical protein FG2_2603 [Lactococcus cremoris]KZK46624.1 hypothetical protein SK110_1573 [Lactococcus cremoris]
MVCLERVFIDYKKLAAVSETNLSLFIDERKSLSLLFICSKIC